MSVEFEVDDLLEVNEQEKDSLAKAVEETEPPKSIKTSNLGQVFDIEPGPRPWEEIEKFYQPPQKLPPFDESMVKYGNLKDETKRE